MNGPIMSVDATCCHARRGVKHLVSLLALVFCVSACRKEEPVPGHVPDVAAASGRAEPAAGKGDPVVGKVDPVIGKGADLGGAPGADESSPKVSPPSVPSPQGGFFPFRAVDETDPAALEVPSEGAAQPLVMIVEAGSYECPHTREAEAVVQSLLSDFPEAARYWLHNPLPGQKAGNFLALAASAAHRQGRFWEFHRLLIEQGESLDEDHLLALARRSGLDVSLFLKDMKRPELKQHVERNRILAAVLGLTGTPTFLVNGKIVLGLVGRDKLKDLIARELEAARAMRGKVSSLRDLHLAIATTNAPYRTVLEKGVDWRRSLAADPANDPSARWRVRADGRPVLGAAEALVTIVEYIDLTCPFSRKAWEQAEAFAVSNPGLARFFFVLNPKELSGEARSAAAAAGLAAQRGTLRAFADEYFAHQGQDGALGAACTAAGIPECPTDMWRSAEFQDAFERTRVEAVRLFAAGTPVYYVNGLRRSGLLPDDELRALVSSEEELARDLVGKGLPASSVYRFLAGRGTELPLLADEETALSLDGLSPLGAEKPRVRIVVMWDDGSPYCRQLWPHIARLLQRYPTEVAVYQKPYVAGVDEAPPPAVYVNSRRLRVPTGIDYYSLSAAVGGYLPVTTSETTSLQAAPAPRDTSDRGPGPRGRSSP